MSVEFAVAVIPLLIGFFTYGFAIRRILVSKSTSGTSATSLTVSAVSCVVWAVWSYTNDYPLLFWVNALWIPLLIIPELLAMAYVKPLRWGSWQMIPAWSFIAVIGGIVTLAGGWDMLGLLVSLSGLLWLAPALRELYRHSDLSGVSATAWIISGVSTLTWGIYGILDGAWAAIAYSIVQLLGIALALARIWYVHVKK